MTFWWFIAFLAFWALLLIASLYIKHLKLKDKVAAVSSPEMFRKGQELEFYTVDASHEPDRTMVVTGVNRKTGEIEFEEWKKWAEKNG